MGDVIPFNRSNRRKAERDVKNALDKMSKINREVDSMASVDFSGLKFPMIVLFNKPLDFPNKIVGRVFEMQHPTNIVVLYDSQKEARQDAVAAGFQTVIPRDPKDDVHIIETYIR